jgi:hypothetical protein
MQATKVSFSVYPLSFKTTAIRRWCWMEKPLERWLNLGQRDRYRARPCLEDAVNVSHDKDEYLPLSKIFMII